MTRLIDHDPQRGLLKIHFPYDTRLLELVRSLPGRRWDANVKAWMVPSVHLWGVLSVLGAHGFELTGEAAALLNTLPKPTVPALVASLPAPPDPPQKPQTSSLDRAVAFVENMLVPVRAAPLPQTPKNPADPADAEGPDTTDTSNTLSVSAISHRARQVLRAAFPDELWVVGELSGYTRGSQRSFMSFDLLERPTPDANPIAQIQAVMRSEDRRRIEARLQAAREPFTLQDGLQVRLRVSIDFFTQYGKFQLLVRDIDPAYTLGQLAVRRDEILRQLAALELLHTNRDLPLPWLPLRVALLTSPQGEAVQDFLHGLRASQIGFHVTLFGIRVQGPRLVPDLCGALAHVAANKALFDVVLIIRGGGSRADLAWFDHIDAALAVARLPLKVIVGIGHQRDQSVLDLIAHSEKTPTAAAECLVRCVEEASIAQDHLWTLIQDQARERLRQASTALTSQANALTASFRDLLARSALGVERLQTHLTTRSKARVVLARRNLSAAAHDLQVGARLNLRSDLKALSALQDRLTHPRLQKRFSRAQDTLRDAQQRLNAKSREALRGLSQQLEVLDARRRLLDPLSVMARGYARVSTLGGVALGSVLDCQPGDTLRVTLRDGHLLTTIQTTEANADVQEETRRAQLPTSDAGASPDPRRHRGRRHKP